MENYKPCGANQHHEGVGKDAKCVANVTQTKCLQDGNVWYKGLCVSAQEYSKGGFNGEKNCEAEGGECHGGCKGLNPSGTSCVDFSAPNITYSEGSDGCRLRSN